MYGWWLEHFLCVWDTVDRLSEKSSNYDELAGYWFLDEFLSCLGSIIVLIQSHQPLNTDSTNSAPNTSRDIIVKKIYRTILWIVDPVTSIIVIIARIVVDNFLLQGMSLVPLWSYSKYSSLMIHGWWDLIVMNFNLKYGKCKFVCTAQ